MRYRIIHLLITWLLAMPALAQRPSAGDTSRYTISFRSGNITPSKNINRTGLESLDRSLLKRNGKALVLIQFDAVPSASGQEVLRSEGIQLLDFIGGNAYTAQLRAMPGEERLKSLKVRAIQQLMPAQKMEQALVTRRFPTRSVKKPGTIDVWITCATGFTIDEVRILLGKMNLELLPVGYESYGILALRVPQHRLEELAAEPFVTFVQAAPGEDQLLNNKSIAQTRGNVLRSTAPGGRALTGSGITIGVGDDSNPLRHIDFDGRMINRNAAAGGSHGIHVMGTAAGGGLRDERIAGYASRARIVAQYVSGILANAPAYVSDYDMVVTNNSYGNVVDDCTAFGVYDIYSYVMDQQTVQLPHLLHVFAAGNSGLYNCSPYANGFSNVLGGYQTAKNTIAVGNIDEFGVISIGSSKGPVRDGRIKPEVVTQGTRLLSTFPVNTYGGNAGTSMSAPAVTGGLALLYERYKQLHGGNNPDNALMKALLCNGATDAGNEGPDYSYGFGIMNLLRSVRMLEQNNFFIQTVAPSASNTHQVNIGTGVAELKVMLYWNDAPASPLAAKALLNDLDLTVTGPGGTFFPQLLNSSPALAGSPATTGPDHVNNIEQVVIKNPAPGSYTFTVNGYVIPGGAPYKYSLVFDTLMAGITLTNPTGGERVSPGDSTYVSWDAYGNNGNGFSLAFSADNGATWTPIDNNIPAGTRQYKWFAPATVTKEARIRVEHNGTGFQHTSSAFTIVGTPVASLASVQCEGYIALNWTAVAGATDYEVSILRNGEMVPVATTTATTYTFSGLSRDTAYWVSVCARYNGEKGRRALAVTRQPNNGTCTGTISDNDLKIDAVLAPVSGRELTSTALTAATPVRVRIKNLDNAAVSSFLVKYAINGGAFISENNTSGITSLGLYTHTFSTPANLSATGDYLLTAVVENLSASDPVKSNDTLRVIVRHLANNPVILTAGTQGLMDDIELARDTAYHFSHTGIYGAERFDFNANTANGRLRSFVNSGIARSGTKAFTLDSWQYVAAGVADSLRATYNLSGYAATSDDIRLDFYYKQHGQMPNAATKVWVRGNDQQPWLSLYDLFANQPAPGSFKHTRSLEISDLLQQNSQDFSSSFQVRWGQWGQYITADDFLASGYTFDDIHLYKVVNDLQMISIDTPVVASCGLTSSTPVRITVRNSSNNTITNIPVKMQTGDGPVITETIAAIPGKTLFSYTFTATANLADTGAHVLKVWVDLPADSYKENDTSRLELYNAPVVAAFPYLQDFESGSGNWRASGQNSSWEFGTPASARIKNAASGANAWKTALVGNYNDRELSYLYSPCFNISTLTAPMLSFSVALDLEDCNTSLCDAAWVEYSTDGLEWKRLGNLNEGTNWYNRSYSLQPVWSVQYYTRWHVASIPLPAGNYTSLRLRFVMQSDPYVSREGIAVDDIHIFDRVAGIYDGPPYESDAVTITSPVSNDWNYFLKDNKLVGAVHPANQTLNATLAKVYINQTGVRDTLDQYYHDRNLVIQPANKNTVDSLPVRLYFLDKESDSLIFADGCATCVKPVSAYQLSVGVYNDAVAKENGTMADNAEGTWSFIPREKMRIVPYDKGYYAEFKTRKAGEFWLLTEALTNTNPPLAVINSFSAIKTPNQTDVLVQWQMGQERHIDRYEVQVAVGNTAYQQGIFNTITIISGGPNSTTATNYTYTDTEPGKSGVRYYRIKITDRNGVISYSDAIPVVFTAEVSFQIYPNPSTGIFNLVYQLETGRRVNLAVYDMQGRVVFRKQLTATAFLQKEEINLSALAGGLYFLEVAPADGEKKMFRIVRQ